MLPHSSYRPSISPPGNVSEMLLRDVASLLLTTELISSFLVALRPECQFSPELTHTLNSMIALCDDGETRVQQPLLETGIILPTTTDASPSTLITDFFQRLPTAADPQIFGAEVIVNLQLLAQHVELKARLASDEALIVGLDGLNAALNSWSNEWQTCAKEMGKLSVQFKNARTTETNRLAFAMPSEV